MPHINLLPWRDERRKELQKQFIIMLAASAIIAIGSWLAVNLFIEERISFQKERNKFLDDEIAAMEKKTKDVEELKQKLAGLRARMDIVQRLQASRPEIVHLFDEIPRILPIGVNLTSFSQKGRALNFEGTAQSNNQISNLMRNINNSKWLQDPVLNIIQTSQQGNDRINKFILNAKQPELKEDKNIKPPPAPKGAAK